MSKQILVPNIGDFSDVEVIEILVAPGDTVKAEDSLISVESDKASMEIPSPEAGTVKELKVKVGEKVSEGSLILLLEPSAGGATAAASTGTVKAAPAAAPAPASPPVATKPAAPVAAPVRAAPSPAAPVTTPMMAPGRFDEAGFARAYASPGVRRFARELGVDLGRVGGSGRKGRITQDDVKAFVKQVMTQGLPAAGGLQVAPLPAIDFAKWGEVETRPLTKINKLTGQFLHRNWVTIPHVTQFDEADITDMEAQRKAMAAEYKARDIRITPLVFLMKAIVKALQEYPRFNSSLDAGGENLVFKKYFNVGIAVDTPDGLVVPVVQDVDRKSLVDLAVELGEISARARDKKLKPADLQGGCITISSLGGIGGTKFTPIVNAPEVAILGVSRSKMQPVWNGKEFMPRLMLPLALSYDHRVIDGADGARFTTFLCGVLADPKTLA
ncbi:MAG: dihydrolipoyllysine-residue acetyltransferase [Gammaproteobacteria bacterium]|nr:dihydrolipoyllysine-residue acetyltransferase [Gammaproteobacteria bacterium]